MRITKCYLYTFLAVGVFLLFQADATEATLQANKLFKETYPGKDVAYYSCAICHNAKIGKKGDLNPYGKSLKLTPPATLTVEQLKAAESLDPDGDSVPSGKEIEEGTHPGDPASHP